jgi:hypothetical protein
VNIDDLKPIWSTSDFRETVMLLRAWESPEYADVAPVIDIHTRARIA